MKRKQEPIILKKTEVKLGSDGRESSECDP